ncbi:MAG: hypothetical protein M1831_004728 [Alyxoria varia]|nr:MAG: hypothetical protein M1831_004728 [Alyxoria varia]
MYDWEPSFDPNVKFDEIARLCTSSWQVLEDSLPSNVENLIHGLHFGQVTLRQRLQLQRCIADIDFSWVKDSLLLSLVRLVEFGVRIAVSEEELETCKEALARLPPLPSNVTEPHHHVVLAALVQCLNNVLHHGQERQDLVNEIVGMSKQTCIPCENAYTLLRDYSSNFLLLSSSCQLVLYLPFLDFGSVGGFDSQADMTFTSRRFQSGTMRSGQPITVKIPRSFEALCRALRAGFNNDTSVKRRIESIIIAEENRLWDLIEDGWQV